MICAAFALACLTHFAPPKEYDFEPTKPYQIATLPLPLVAKACGRPAMACTLIFRRVIVLSDGLKGDDRAAILRHEKAHLNGWQHPSAIVPTNASANAGSVPTE